MTGGTISSKKHDVPEALLTSLLTNYQKPEDLIGENGLLKQLTNLLVEKALDAEIANHLGQDKHQPVVNALIKQARKLPQELYKSLTWDRGKEMAAHKRFTLATDIQVYFCDPQHPWQRGTNENTNGLLRQYFPKGMSLANYSQAQLNAVARKLNERPRKTLYYETPADRLAQSVALTG